MTQPLELDSLGILRQTKVPQELSWLSDVEKSFLIEILMAGEEGVHKRRVAKVDKEGTDTIFNITIRGLAQWENDKAGRPTFLVLTWKGDEVAQLLLQIAKRESQGCYVKETLKDSTDE
jgi:hypothetical protein